MKNPTILRSNSYDYTKGRVTLMPEHLIRLRGGWERLETGASSGFRLTLPLISPVSGDRPLRLLRFFQSPTLDPDRESLWLQLASVPELILVTLNHVVVWSGPSNETVILIALDALQPGRNQIILEANPPTIFNEPWGEVALVVRISDKNLERKPFLE